ncbi:MAG: AbrB/MazE/SpoVT family DNA-binding domain-containing protein [bacterium]|jgi:AbrB family looped-hinge helix DNA binding protein
MNQVAFNSVQEAMPPKMLVGRESQVIDGRFRIRLPQNLCNTEIRDVVITLSPHRKWLEILPKWTYEALYNQLWPKTSLSSYSGFINYSDRDYVDNLREVLESHHRTAIDDSQRVVIPQDLREAIGLKQGDTVVLIGMLDKVEVWREEDYVSYSQTRKNRDLSLVFGSEGLKAGGKGGDAGLEHLNLPGGDPASG